MRKTSSLKRRPWRLRQYVLPRKLTPKGYWVARTLAGKGEAVDDWKMLVQMPPSVAMRGWAIARGDTKAFRYDAPLADGVGHLFVCWIPQWGDADEKVRMEVSITLAGSLLVLKIGTWPDALIDCFEEAIGRLAGVPGHWAPVFIELLQEGLELAREAGK